MDSMEENFHGMVQSLARAKTECDCLVSRVCFEQNSALGKNWVRVWTGQSNRLFLLENDSCHPHSCKVYAGNPGDFEFAAAFGDLKKVLEFLACSDTNVNQMRYGYTALFVACLGGHTDVVEALLRAGASPEKTFLQNALKFESNLKFPETITWKLPEILVGLHKNTSLFAILLEYTPSFLVEEWLVQYSQAGNIPILKALLKFGADVNKMVENKSPLLTAASEGQTSTVLLLLHNRADANLSQRDGFTPLMAASSAGNHFAVEALLQNGAEVDACCERGLTALMYASKCGHTSSVQALVVSGANLNCCCKDGNTALMYAVVNCKEEVAHELLNAGSSVKHENKKGFSASDLAFQHQLSSDLMLVLTSAEFDGHFKQKTQNLKVEADFSNLSTRLCKDILQSHPRVFNDFGALVEMFISEKLEREMENMSEKLRAEYEIRFTSFVKNQTKLLEELHLQKKREIELLSELKMKENNFSEYIHSWTVEKETMRDIQEQLERHLLKTKEDAELAQSRAEAHLEEVKGKLMVKIQDLQQLHEKTIKFEKDVQIKLMQELQQLQNMDEKQSVQHLNARLTAEVLCELDEDTLEKIEIYLQEISVNVRRGKEACIRRKSIEADDPKMVCCICLEEHKSVMLLPCNHLCLCQNCSSRKIRVCPVCRAQVEGQVQVFL